MIVYLIIFSPSAPPIKFLFFPNRFPIVGLCGKVDFGLSRK